MSERLPSAVRLTREVLAHREHREQVARGYGPLSKLPPDTTLDQLAAAEAVAHWRTPEQVFIPGCDTCNEAAPVSVEFDAEACYHDGSERKTVLCVDCLRGLLAIAEGR